MRAAYALRHPDYANGGQYGDALTIDTATDLPALIAERDALRDALAGLVNEITNAPPEWFTDECLGVDTEKAYSALALNTKGQT